MDLDLADFAEKRYPPTHRAKQLESVIITFSGLRSYFSPILMLVALTASAGCSLVGDAGSESSGQVKVFRIPWPSGNGDYTLQDISLSTFRDHEKFRGDVASILIDPRIEFGSVVGEEPIGRFTHDGQRYVPSDFVTLQATAIYAHLERLNELDKNYGLNEFFNGPARIGLMARISAGRGTPLVLDNAIYDGRLDSLFFVPYTGTRLPISLNAGIVAHEHYHRIFQSVILNSIREAARMGTIPYGWDDSIACSWHDHAPIVQLPSHVSEQMLPNDLVPAKIYNQVLIRALNEGLADFWGWAYARDDEFVGRSLDENENKARRLDRPALAIPQKLLLRNSLVTVSSSGLPVLKSEQGRVAAAYRFGTEYSRTLRGFVDRLMSDAGLSQDQAVEKVRLALARSMPDLSSHILKQWGRTEIHPELLLKPLLTKLIETAETGSAPLDGAASKPSQQISKTVCAELSRLNASLELTAELCAAAPETPTPVEPGQ